MRTVSNLLIHGEKVYVYLNSDQIAQRFFSDAEKEGFRLPDISAGPDHVYALHSDFTITFIGFCGHMQFSLGDRSNGIRIIDYAKYIIGHEDYFYKREEKR